LKKEKDSHDADLQNPDGTTEYLTNGANQLAPSYLD
jgi:hypothetical protein